MFLDPMVEAPGRPPSLRPPPWTGRPTGATWGGMTPFRLALTTALATLGVASAATAQGWPDSYVGRLEVLALLQSLNAELLSHDSATATLQRWCDDHAIAPGQPIRAHRVRGIDKAAGEAERRLLQVGPDAPIGYRRVQLACGDKVLSEADNWYLPTRLTPEMNQRLDTTETPFGVVVKSLNYQRHTQASALLFHPLPEGWENHSPVEAAGRGTLAIPAKVLQHTALLTTPDGASLSLVVETYTAAVLDIPAPHAPRPAP